MDTLRPALRFVATVTILAMPFISNSADIKYEELELSYLQRPLRGLSLRGKIEGGDADELRNLVKEDPCREVTTMARPTDVKALSGFSIWIRYDDGTKGEVDLSDVAGRGVFGAWKDRTFFESVRLGSHGAIEWGDQIDLCPDAIYMRLTGKSQEEVFPMLTKPIPDA